MKIYRFDPTVGRPITHFDSTFCMARIIRVVGRDASDGAIHVGCMHIPAGGRVGYHQATVPQLFLIVASEGWVTREDGDTTTGACLRGGILAGWRMA